MGQEIAYQYDGVGNMIEKIDGKNQKTQYDYNNAGRLQTIRYYAHAGDTTAVKTVTFDYDELGNLTGYDDGITSATYNYDELSRKIGEEVNYGGFTLANTITYNKDGSKKTFTGPDGVVYDYQYDEGGRLSGIQIPNVGFVTIGEYTWNRPASMTLPGGTRKTYVYDPLMRLKQITTLDPGGNPLLDYSYGYDKMNNIATKTTEHGAYAYAYDDLYRLTAADNPTETDEAFTYDTVGNRLTSADTTSTWGYNQNNELGGYDDVSFEYDANGNMIKKTAGSVVTSYVYNIEDRLTEVWNGEAGSGSLTASYYYDPFGRRLWKEVSGVRTHFHYTDEGLIGEYDAVGNELRTYGYKPGSTWTTDSLFVKEASQYYFYHNDHLGTPQKLTALNGAVVWSAVYSSFGEATIEIETVENNLRFPGQYYDSETGLHYNYHRYYNPNTGRYLKADPIGIQKGKNHLYSYVRNNPILNFDLKGLAVYTGIVNLKGGGYVGGAAVMWGQVRTKCVDGKFQTGFLFAGFIGAAAGVPIGTTVYSITQRDVMSGRGDLKSMNGLAAITSLSIACGPGASIYDLTLGDTRSVGELDGSIDVGVQAGFDGDAIAMGGYSRVSFIQEYCCKD